MPAGCHSYAYIELQLLQYMPLKLLQDENKKRRCAQAWHRAVLAREDRAARKMAADAHGQQRAKRKRFGEWRASAKEELRKYESDTHSRCR